MLCFLHKWYFKRNTDQKKEIKILSEFFTSFTSCCVTIQPNKFFFLPFVEEFQVSKEKKGEEKEKHLKRYARRSFLKNRKISAMIEKECEKEEKLFNNQMVR